MRADHRLRQRGWQPTVIHLSNGDGNTYCRAKNRTWPDNFMKDSVARTLPKCPACLEELSRRKLLIVSHREQAHINTEKQKQIRLERKREEESNSPLYLVDYINKLSKSG